MGDVEMSEGVKEEVETEEGKTEEIKSEEGKTEEVKEEETGPTDENSNGAEQEPAGDAAESTNVDKPKFIKRQLAPEVAEQLNLLYEENVVTPEDFDERAVEMLAGFLPEQAAYLLKQLHESRLFGVLNKPQYLMSIMRNMRDRIQQYGTSYFMANKFINGPAVEDLKQLLERTGYTSEVTVGQRKYGGPPPDWEGPPTGPGTNGHEIYIGHIPHDLYEDKLVPVFEEVGKIWDLRLMMDPVTGQNRGYAFLTYCDKGVAAEAAKKLDGHEIVSGKTLKVNVSVANTRLFIGNIPKSKTKEEILEEFKKHAEGVLDVIIYTSPDAGERNRNRGFCFLDFVDHKAASDAKRKFSTVKASRPFNCDLVVDWAEQQDEPDEEVMKTVKVLYIRHLRENQTEEMLKERFTSFGEVERVKRIKDYAFIHFQERDSAVKALEEMTGQEIDGIKIEVSLAKPMGDKKKRPMRGGRGFSRGYNEGQMRGGRGAAGWGAGGGGPRGAFAGGWGAPPDMFGYDPYAMGGYAGGYDYGAYGAPMAGYAGYGGFEQSGFGGMNRGRVGFGGAARGGVRGRGGPRGAKRPGEWMGGPTAKRADGGQDFTSDVSMGGF